MNDIPTPSSSSLLSATTKEDFILSNTFQGSKIGFVFRSEPHGVGYYKDVETTLPRYNESDAEKNKLAALLLKEEIIRHYDTDYGVRYDCNHPEWMVDMIFFRPDGDTEGKSIQWCVTNGFFEIEPGLWSGTWFWNYHPNHPAYSKWKRLQEIKQKKKECLKEQNEKTKNKPYLDQAKMRADQKRLDRTRLLEEWDYSYGCFVQGCCRRFQTDTERNDHLKTSKGVSHKKFIVVPI